MEKNHLYADGAPDVIGPYSHAVQVGNFVFLSGQIALDPESMELVDDSFRNETKQVFSNVEAVLTAANCTLQDIARITVYLTDLKNFEQVNAVMSEHLSAPFPARTAIGVAALPRGANIELEVIAVSQG